MNQVLTGKQVYHGNVPYWLLLSNYIDTHFITEEIDGWNPVLAIYAIWGASPIFLLDAQLIDLQL